MRNDSKLMNKKDPLIKIDFISHGTLMAKNLVETRRFYEEVLGFEVAHLSPMAMWVRCNGKHVYVVVETGKEQEMSQLNHNGLDVSSNEAVDQAHGIILSIKENYGIKRIKKPHHQHGVYSFYFQDLDGNWWEIVSNPSGGYSSMFDEMIQDRAFMRENEDRFQKD